MKKLELTINQGSLFLADTYILRVPEKIEGLWTWNASTRSQISKNIEQLKEALELHSPLFKSEGVFKFGPEDAYDKIPVAHNKAKKELEADTTGELITHKWVVKPGMRNKTYTVELNAMAWKGLQILLLLRAHPGPFIINDQPVYYVLAPGHLNDFIFPVAKQMGFDEDLRRKIGQGTPETIEFKTNDEIKEEEEAVKKEDNK